MKNKTVSAGIIGIMLALGATGAYSQGFTGPGGFTGSGSGVTPITVSAANNLYDHSPVTLQGKIIRFLDPKKDRFVFKDSTGEVIVEIDHHLWYGLSVSENDTVEIFGYIDRHGWGIEKIEVKAIRKL